LSGFSSNRGAARIVARQYYASAVRQGPGEPWRNGYVESFNSRIRDECLNINSFWSLAQARVVIGD
jgi:hypothetical protein